MVIAMRFPFPNVDPIPLPAPVWLMKALGLLTLAMHFTAVMMMVGSLVMIVFLNAEGRRRRNGAQLSASLTLARRLPVIMTYVINLGVPPLLFAQVLYGRALYTSSVLIAVSWFSVIPLVMAAYWAMYKTTDRIQDGKAGWPTALVALVLAAGVGQIYAMNMTLMLRPEVWQKMYAATATGLQAPPADPTSAPRWLFVLTGGLVFGGLWMFVVSNAKHLAEDVRRTLVRSGGAMALVGGLVQAFFALRVSQTQPAEIQQALAASPLCSASGYAYLGATLLVLVLAGLQFAKGRSSVLLATVGAVVGFLGNAGVVIYRDGIRDYTLASKGFDVWARKEVTNWSVVILFLLLFVIGLGFVYWLLTVMKRATPTNENLALAGPRMGDAPLGDVVGSVESDKEFVQR
jgi:hypothetical protein